MKNYSRTLLKENNAFIRSNNREEFHKSYRAMYRLGYRREESFYVNLWLYKEFWVKLTKNKSTLEKIQEIASDEPSPWLAEARERQNIAENEPSLWLAEARERQMYLNMQYYYEYVVANGYVTPQDWLENHKHF